eukprot:11187909-Lingulodinium_polyedra.AAC.1
MLAGLLVWTVSSVRSSASRPGPLPAPSTPRLSRFPGLSLSPWPREGVDCRNMAVQGFHL